jgi:RNA polymerase sigma factor (sigma-70 family)
MMEDAELLSRYVHSRSEIDFTVLVERHLNLVYQAALRRAGGRSDLAQEVTQQVFTTLAREAPKLVAHPALVGWLFTATRHAAGHLLRTERRRQEREIEAIMRNSLDNSTSNADWDKIRDQLDEVMDKLAEQDRTAILLRFFHNQAFGQIGLAFGLSEDTARKRVERALERLRGLLAKRGVTSTASALGVILASQSASAAPTGLAQTIASAALLPGATASLPATGLLYFMNTKIALSIAGTFGLAALLSLPPLGLAVYKSHEATIAETTATNALRENEHRQAELSKLQAQAREADQKAAALKAELDSTQQENAALTKTLPPATSPPRNKAEADALADGKEFLSRFPGAGRMLVELARAQIHANFTGFYRTANLTAAQIDELENRTAEFCNESLLVTPTGISPLVGQLPDDQLQQILGDENFQRFKGFNRARAAHAATARAELAAGYASVPLSPEQSQHIVQTIIENSEDFKSGGNLKLETVDWSAATGPALKVLTPEQRKAVQPLLLQMQFQIASDKAQKKAAAEHQKP